MKGHELTIRNWHSSVQDMPVSRHVDPVDEYLKTISSDASKTTARSVIRRVADILGFFEIDVDSGERIPMPENVRWHQIDRGVIQAVIEQLKKDGKSTSTQNLYLSILKGVARHAFLFQLMSDAQYALIRELKATKQKRRLAGRAIYAQEISRLIDHCLKSEGLAGTRDAALLGVLFGAGPRRSEVVSIDVRDVKLTSSSIEITGKGNKDRTLALPPRSVELLEIWLEESGIRHGPLFRRITRTGVLLLDKRLTADGIYTIVQKRIAQAGLDKASPHDFRRGFLTYLADIGTDVATMADLAGHSSIDTTKRYLRDQERRNQAAVQGIEF